MYDNEVLSPISFDYLCFCMLIVYCLLSTVHILAAQFVSGMMIDLNLKENIH